jgi:hypothetical protein
VDEVYHRFPSYVDLWFIRLTKVTLASNQPLFHGRSLVLEFDIAKAVQLGWGHAQSQGSSVNGKRIFNNNIFVVGC